jgi:hypothetical protein
MNPPIVYGNLKSMIMARNLNEIVCSWFRLRFSLSEIMHGLWASHWWSTDHLPTDDTPLGVMQISHCTVQCPVGYSDSIVFNKKKRVNMYIGVKTNLSHCCTVKYAFSKFELFLVNLAFKFQTLPLILCLCNIWLHYIYQKSSDFYATVI